MMSLLICITGPLYISALHEYNMVTPAHLRITGLHQHLLGSVAQKVLAKATVPVMVVR